MNTRRVRKPKKRTRTLILVARKNDNKEKTRKNRSRYESRTIENKRPRAIKIPAHHCTGCNQNCLTTIFIYCSQHTCIIYTQNNRFARTIYKSDIFWLTIMRHYLLLSMASCIFLNRSIILICLSNSLSLRGRTAHTVIFPFGDVMRSMCFFAISPPLFVLLVVKHFPKFTNNACLCVNVIPFHLSSFILSMLT